MFEDDYRYEDEADDFEYIDDDEEEDENALWDDEDAVDAEPYVFLCLMGLRCIFSGSDLC